MSYGTLYTLEFDDYFEQTHQILIQENGYAGASSDVFAAGDPYSFNPDTASDFILEPINGSYATMRLLSQTDFQFINLYTSDNRKYKIIHNIDAVLFWKGFLLTDQYQEQYRGVPYVNSFMAADQLGYLKTLAWDRTDLSLTILQGLGYILQKTDLDLNLWEGVNIYENGHAKTATDSPLNQTYFNPSVYAGLTYYDALYDILLKFSAVIKQDQGTWFIYRPTEAVAAYNRRLWTYSAGVFTYSTQESYDPVVSTTSALVARDDLVRMTPQSSMFIRPAWQSYRIIQDYGKRLNSLDNGNFTEWSGANPSYWYPFGTVSNKQVDGGMKIYPRSAFSYSSLSQTFGSQSNIIKFNLKYDVYVAPGKTLVVYFGLQIQRVTWYNYNFNTRQWVTANAFYTKTFDNSAGASALTESVDFTEITEDISTAFHGTTAKVFIYSPVGYVTGYVTVKEITTNILKPDDTAYEEELIEDVPVNLANSHVPADITLLSADTPYPGNTDQESVYYGILANNAALTDYAWRWMEGGIGAQFTLRNILKQTLSKLYLHPIQVLSLQIYSKLLFPSSVIQEINNSNRLFMMRRSTWHPKQGYWETEAFEIGQGAGAALEAEDGQDILTEAGSTILT